jgi:hypothetical protein
MIRNSVITFLGVFMLVGVMSCSKDNKNTDPTKENKFTGPNTNAAT